MSRYRIEMTSQARSHLHTITAWWRENRSDRPDLPKQEMAEIGARLSVVPRLGAPYRHDQREIRRVLLPRTKHHLYYQIDETRRVITVLAVWHNARGRSPRL